MRQRRTATPLPLSSAPGEPFLLSMWADTTIRPVPDPRLAAINLLRVRRDALRLDQERHGLPRVREESLALDILHVRRRHEQVAVLEQREGVLAADHLRIDAGGRDERGRRVPVQSCVHAPMALGVVEREVPGHQLVRSQLAVQEHDRSSDVFALELVHVRDRPKWRRDASGR